jgi:predicted Zn-dependent protease
MLIMCARINRLLPWLFSFILYLPLPAQQSQQLALYYGIAEGHYLIGDLQGANSSLAEILKLDPYNLLALTLKARIELKRGQNEAALSSIQAALRSNPDNLELQVLEAKIQSASMGPLAAIDQVLQVYTDKDQPAAQQQRTSLLIMRSQALALGGELETSIQNLQQLTGRQPENLEATITLASLYACAGRWAALESLIPSISAHNELKDIALYFEGRALLAKNRVGSAREKFKQALGLENLAKLAAALHFYHGACLVKLEKVTAGRHEIIQALDAQFQAETEAEILLASRSLLGEQQNERAIALLEKLTLQKTNSSAEAWNLLGRAHQTTGTSLLAISAFNQSLRINPQQSAVRGMRAGLLRKIGDLTGAAADYEAASMLDPNNLALVYALGLVQLQQGALIAAEQNIGLAARSLTNHPGIQLIHSLIADVIGAHKTSKLALARYFERSSEQINETAYFLQYSNSNDNGLKRLKVHAAASNASQSLVNFYRFCSGQLNMTATLDAAGMAHSPELAAKKICASAYWMAQHSFKQGELETCEKLLDIATEIGNPDLTEYQLAVWKLKKLCP